MKECILNSAPKSCELDPIPSKLLIECLDSILPSLTDLFNSSLASGIFPQYFKSALVTPILKKKCLDHNDLNNYRPVSNLCFIAKILEKLVLSQVSSYLNSHNLYNTCQSAYRPGNSTETALLTVVNDLLLSLNKGNISVLALLDFSSAFDTIDHPILVHRLHTDFGFTDTVLQWFSPYLTDRTHYVSLSNHYSAFTHVHSGVPQGSVLGPMLGSTHDVTSHLQRIQNYAARVILRLPMSSSITIHLKSLLWLPVKVRSTCKIACLCYHCYSSTAPSYVTDMLHKKPLHTLNTRSSSYTMPLLNRPAHSKATLGDRSFSFASSSVWNSIPNDVRCAPSLSSFKSRWKTYYLCIKYQFTTLRNIPIIKF